jgi:hypothetical protein
MNVTELFARLMTGVEELHKHEERKYHPTTAACGFRIRAS